MGMDCTRAMVNARMLSDVVFGGLPPPEVAEAAEAADADFEREVLKPLTEAFFLKLGGLSDALDRGLVEELCGVCNLSPVEETPQCADRCAITGLPATVCVRYVLNPYYKWLTERSSEKSRLGDVKLHAYLSAIPPQPAVVLNLEREAAALLLCYADVLCSLRDLKWTLAAELL